MAILFLASVGVWHLVTRCTLHEHDGVHIFVKDDCPACQDVYSVIKEIKGSDTLDVILHNAKDHTAVATFAAYGVTVVPTVICSCNGRTVRLPPPYETASILQCWQTLSTSASVIP